MLREQFVNNFSTTLNGAINNSVTSVVLTSVTGLPTGGGYRLIIGTEIMFVSSRSSFTLTVIRGYESSTAASHADLDPATVVVTAGALDSFRKYMIGDMGIAPYVASLSADDDNFDDESFSGWTAVGSTPTITQAVEQNHRYSVIIPASSANAQYYSWMKNKTPSAGDYVQAGFLVADAGSQFPIPAVIMANGSTWNAGKQIVWGYSPHEFQYFIRDMTGYNAHVGATGYGTIQHQPYSAMHIRLEFVSNDHYSGYVSGDGLLWAKVFNNLNIGSIGAAPTWLGFGMTSWGASREMQMSCTYCRFSF